MVNEGEKLEEANEQLIASDVTTASAVAKTSIALSPANMDRLAGIASDAARSIRTKFGFGFVGVSLVPSMDAPVLEWKYASGSTSSNYELIRLPKSVGALGKVFGLGRGIIVDSVEDDIPENERFQYPIVIAEALQGFLSFPLMRGGEMKVILICGSRFVRYFDDAFASEVQLYAANVFDLQPCPEAAIRIQGKQEGFAYAEITQRILQAQESERKRIARELHDGISQEILVAQMGLRRLKYLPPEQWPEEVEKVSNSLRDTITHIGSMAKALRPASLDGLGLSSAMRELCSTVGSSFGITTTENIQDVTGLNETAELSIYRIFQEALSNACKYSKAETIQVSLLVEDGMVTLTVTDDGCGFDTQNPQAAGTGLGLEGMRERAALINGDLVIQSTLDRGTTIQLRVKEGGAQ